MAEALFLRHPRTHPPLRVLLTPPDEQAAETADLVRAAGGEPLLFPCLFRAPPADARAFSDALQSRYDLIAVTSANGALAVAEALADLPAAAAAELRRTPFAAVGPRTAAALAAHGLATSLLADEESSGEGLFAAIANSMQRRGENLSGLRVLLPRAAIARNSLGDALRAAGAAVTETVAYQMVAAPPASLLPLRSLLQAGEVDLAPFGSPRTAEIALAGLAAPAIAPPAELFSRVVVGAIGATTATALRQAGLRVDVVAKEATFAGLLASLHAHLVNVFDGDGRA